MKTDPLDQYAPTPGTATEGRSAGQVTAEAFTRYSLVRAWAALALLSADDLTDEQRRHQIARYTSHVSIAALLWRLTCISEDIADQAAADLWTSLHSDSAPNIERRLIDYDLSPDAIRDTAVTAWRERTAELAKSSAA